LPMNLSMFIACFASPPKTENCPPSEIQ
jgi:hypothetical protein